MREVRVVFADAENLAKCSINFEPQIHVAVTLLRGMHKVPIHYIGVQELISSHAQAQQLAAQTQSDVVLWGTCNDTTSYTLNCTVVMTDAVVQQELFGISARKFIYANQSEITIDNLNEEDSYFINFIVIRLAFLTEHYWSMLEPLDTLIRLGEQATKGQIEHAQRLHLDAAYFCRALVLAEVEHEYKSALNDYNAGIAINPQVAESYYDRGLMKAKLDNHLEAIQDYDQAIQLAPQLAIAHFQRGAAKYELNDKEGAIAAFDHAITVDDQLTEAYYYRGVAKGNIGDKLGAMRDFNQAIALVPNYAHVYYNRALLKSKLDNKQDAIRDYDTVIQHDPEHAKAYVGRADAKSALGDKKGAILDYGIALRLRPLHVLTFYKRANAKFDLGDFKSAILDYSQAIWHDPNFARAYSNRGLAYRKLDNFASALADFQKYAEFFPDDSDMANLIAETKKMLR